MGLREISLFLLAIGIHVALAENQWETNEVHGDIDQCGSISNSFTATMKECQNHKCKEKTKANGDIKRWCRNSLNACCYVNYKKCKAWLCVPKNKANGNKLTLTQG